jgi:hypothetical protein
MVVRFVGKEPLDRSVVKLHIDKAVSNSAEEATALNAQAHSSSPTVNLAKEQDAALGVLVGEVEGQLVR